MILGIDEVGRGPWAGPLVVGAVVLGGVIIEGLTDSKKLSALRRRELSALIYTHGVVGLGWVHADEIDRIGLAEALRLATTRAVEHIHVPYHEIIIDGTVNFLQGTSKGQYVNTIKKADLLVPCVSAASIVAKVARDTYMTEQHSIYPHYGFNSHVGYGTQKHRKAIEEYGITPLHRLSIAPLKKYAITQNSDYSGPSSVSGATGETQLRSRHDEVVRKEFMRKRLKGGIGWRGGVKRQKYDNEVALTTKVIGDAGEDAAVLYLKKKGHAICDRNWKTKYCEIDIVSLCDDTLYFTEVKYRKKADQGGGMAAITPKKLCQMKFAAEYYMIHNNLENVQPRVAVAEVAGHEYSVQQWLTVDM